MNANVRSRPNSILREVAFAYVRAYEKWERLQQRGNVERADEAYSQMQNIENSVQVLELNGSWR